MFTRTQQLTLIDTQLARTGLPAENVTALNNAKTALSDPSLAVMDDMSGYAYQIQSVSNMIPCTTVSGILTKLANMESLLTQVIDDTFGDLLSAITAFVAMATQAILDATGISDGLNTLIALAKDFAKQMGILNGLNIPIVSDPCLSQIAQKSYQYLTPSEQANIDSLNALSQTDRQSAIQSKLKNLGSTAFSF